MYSLSHPVLDHLMGPRIETTGADGDLDTVAREVNRRLTALGAPAWVEPVRATGDGSRSELCVVPTGTVRAAARSFSVRLDPDRSPGWVERTVGAILARLPAPPPSDPAPVVDRRPIGDPWCDPS